MRLNPKQYSTSLSLEATSGSISISSSASDISVEEWLRVVLLKGQTGEYATMWIDGNDLEYVELIGTGVSGKGLSL